MMRAAMESDACGPLRRGGVGAAALAARVPSSTLRLRITCQGVMHVEEELGGGRRAEV